MDKKRILSKIDELDSYLEEIDSIKPSSLEEYGSSIEKKRSCERLLQISIETVIDICNILVSNLKLGLPSDEEDIFLRLEKKKVITNDMAGILSDMKGFRNILVHRYGTIDDELVFEMLANKLEDFDRFKQEIIAFINK